MFFENAEFAVSTITRIKFLADQGSEVDLNSIVESLGGSVRCHFGLSAKNFNDYVSAFQDGDCHVMAEIKFYYPDQVFWLIDKILEYVYVDRFEPQEIVDQLLRIDFEIYCKMIEEDDPELSDHLILPGHSKIFFDNMTGLVALAADPDSGMSKADLIEYFVDRIILDFDDLDYQVVSDYLAQFLANNVYGMRHFRNQYPDLSNPAINRLLNLLYSPSCSPEMIRDWVRGWKAVYLPAVNGTFCANFK